MGAQLSFKKTSAMASGRWRHQVIALVLVSLSLQSTGQYRQYRTEYEANDQSLEEEKRFKLSLGGGSLKASLGGSAKTGGSSKISIGGNSGSSIGGGASISAGGGASIAAGGSASVSAGGSATAGGKAGIKVGTDAPNPVTEVLNPATETPLPATEAPKPPTEAPRPATETPNPATEAPIPGTEAPIPSTNVPIDRPQTPLPVTVEPDTPAPGTKAPIEPTKEPSCHTPSKVLPSDNVCEIWDINNVKTFDGLQYFIPSTSLVGSTLLLSHDLMADAFSIQIKLISDTALEIYLYEDGVLKMVLRSKNNKLITDHMITGFEIVQKAGHILIISDSGYELIWDLKMYVGVEITKEEEEVQVEGLCGFNLGDGESDEVVLGDLSEYVKNSKNGNCTYCTASMSGATVCDKMLQDKELGLGACNQLLDVEMFMKACSEGFCRDGIEAACSSAEMYAKICQRLGGNSTLSAA